MSTYLSPGVRELDWPAKSHGNKAAPSGQNCELHYKKSVCFFNETFTPPIVFPW